MATSPERERVSSEIPSPLASSGSRPDPSRFDFGIDWWTMLMDPEYLRNPYPELKRIREIAPVHCDAATGIFFVLGYQEFGAMARAKEMGRDIRYWSKSWNSPENRQRDPAAYELFREFQPQMINANPPDHRRMRGIFEKAFRPANMARYLPMIEAECTRLLDAVSVGEPFDFMTAFANVLPHRISLNLFDIPQEMEAPVAKWIAALSWIGNIITTPEQKQDAQVAQHDFKAYLREHLATRKSEPGDDFIGLAMEAFCEGTMDEEENLNNLAMLISGSRTTLTLLGNGMLSLLRHPAQFDRLRHNRDLMRTAIEEMLRYEPGSSIIPRAGVSDFLCGEVLFPAGSLALGLVGAVNRDPAAFANPDEFDVAREPNTHYVFGLGPHICIGKALARLTAQVAFTMLMDRYPRIELAGEPEWWVDRSDQRGLNRLPLLLGPN